MQLRKLVPAILYLVAALPADAQTSGWKEGRIIKIWADPSDMVVEMNVNGPCDSAFFHIQRSATNFTEFAALKMRAAPSGRMVNLLVTGCNGDRNVFSHGAAYFQRIFLRHAAGKPLRQAFLKAG